MPAHELRNMCLVRIQFCEEYDQMFMAVCPFPREVNLKEGQSCIYLTHQRAEFGVDRSQMKKTFRNVRAKCRKSDTKKLFYNFSMNRLKLQNTFHIVSRVPMREGFDDRDLKNADVVHLRECVPHVESANNRQGADDDAIWAHYCQSVSVPSIGDFKALANFLLRRFLLCVSTRCHSTLISPPRFNKN